MSNPPHFISPKVAFAAPDRSMSMSPYVKLDSVITVAPDHLTPLMDGSVMDSLLFCLGKHIQCVAFFLHTGLNLWIRTFRYPDVIVLSLFDDGMHDTAYGNL